MRIWGLIALTGILTSNTFAAATGKTLFTETFEHGLSKRWEPVKFEGQTDYKVVKDGDNAVLQATAASAASGLGTKINLQATPGTTLSWRWKIDKIPPGSSDDTKKTFDHTARIFVAFKTRLGPPRTINYVWGNVAKANTTYHHPSSGRARFIVLQSGNANAGKWLEEKRDLYADWQKLFPEEGEPPAIVSIGLMTDSDGVKKTVTGSYDDFAITQNGK